MTLHHQDKMTIEIQRIVSDIIRNDIKDPRISVDTVGINRVEVSRDVSFARIYFSILTNPEEQKNILNILEKARGYIRTKLAQKLQIRRVPELDFKIDTSIENAIKMATLLDRLQAEEMERSQSES